MWHKNTVLEDTMERKMNLSNNNTDTAFPSGEDIYILFKQYVSLKPTKGFIMQQNNLGSAPYYTCRKKIRCHISGGQRRLNCTVHVKEGTGAERQQLSTRQNSAGIVRMLIKILQIHNQDYTVQAPQAWQVRLAV